MTREAHSCPPVRDSLVRTCVRTLADQPTFIHLDWHLDQHLDSGPRHLDQSRWIKLDKVIARKGARTPECWEKTAGHAEELAGRGETAPYEKQMIRKDGSRCAVKFVAPGVKPKVRVWTEVSQSRPCGNENGMRDGEMKGLIWVEDNGVGIPNGVIE